MMDDLTLESLSAELRPAVAQEDTFTIDLTFLFPKKQEAGEKVEYTYKKLPASLFFGNSLYTIVQLIKNQRPQTDASLMLEMAFLIGCHVAPVCENAGMLVPIYCQMFDRMTEGEKYLIIEEFGEKSGKDFVGQMKQMIEDRKKNTQPPRPQRTRRGGNSSVSASATAKSTRANRRS